MAKLKRRGQDWRRKLRPIRLRDGRTLQILGDCRAYALDLPEGVELQDKWQRAIALMLAAAEGGDLEAVVDQFERILLPENKVKLS